PEGCPSRRASPRGAPRLSASPCEAEDGARADRSFLSASRRHLAPGEPLRPLVLLCLLASAPCGSCDGHHAAFSSNTDTHGAFSASLCGLTLIDQRDVMP